MKFCSDFVLIYEQWIYEHVAFGSQTCSMWTTIRNLPEDLRDKEEDDKFTC